MDLSSRTRAAWTRVRKSRIGVRVFAFNLLVLFLPIAGVLYLGVYESNLLEMQERGMIEQARAIAAGLGRPGATLAEDAALVVPRLAEYSDARVRIFDRDGRLVARSVPRAAIAGTTVYQTSSGSLRDRMLYRFGAWLVKLKRRLARWWVPPDEAAAAFEDSESNVPPEVGTALSGRYGAATRPTKGQRSLTLSSAVPIYRDGAVVGAVVVSQSTFRVLHALYGIRLRIFEVVLASIVVASILSAMSSATIVRPLVRLRHAASSLADRRTPVSATFRVVDRQDEIGDLAGALEELVLRLDGQIRIAESFSADVAHEFKNPLASIRTAAEMLAAADSQADRDRFFRMLTRDVDRLGRLVSGVRELAKVDAQVAHDPATDVNLAEVLGDITRRMQHAGVPVSIAVRCDECKVRASRDRLLQVFENVLDNAHSFAQHGPIEIAVERADGSCRVTIEDSGPGIPDAHLERVFERFFSYRPEDQDGGREHAGLGLAIARAIVQGYGGRITAANREQGGARFTIDLPVAMR
jgi:two-component system sensor histidine kinase ChvG